MSAGAALWMRIAAGTSVSIALLLALAILVARLLPGENRAR